MGQIHEKSIIAEHLMFGEQGLTDVIRFKACDKKIYGFAATFKRDGCIMIGHDNGDNTRDIDSALVSHTTYCIRPFTKPEVAGDAEYNPEAVYAGYEARWGNETYTTSIDEPTTLESLPKKIAQAPASAVDGFSSMFEWKNFSKHTSMAEKICLIFVAVQVLGIFIHPILRVEYAVFAPIVRGIFSFLTQAVISLFAMALGK